MKVIALGRIEEGREGVVWKVQTRSGHGTSCCRRRRYVAVFAAIAIAIAIAIAAIAHTVATFAAAAAAAASAATTTARC
ncbi:hypothetical protein M0802_007749 [Mischocyttarus mexicanus]|nr:hypothetical protein M0802_007749 [Mischocyttarus mexicanus]